MMNYTGKVVWITGASSGIGEGLALLLAEKGAKIILSSRSVDKLEAVRNSLKNKEQHLVVPLDLEKQEEFDACLVKVMEHYGRIDVLVNNGGLSQRSNVRDTSIDVDRRIMEINYFGNIALTKKVLPIMIEQKSGQFLVISSIAGKFGFYLRSAYSASKHALHGFYESLALEEAENGIFVTLACPGKINTNISKSALNAAGDKHGVMDHNQSTGMSVEECCEQLIHALSKKKREVLIGNKEIKAVTLKRLLPNLFWKVIKGQSAT